MQSDKNYWGSIEVQRLYFALLRFNLRFKSRLQKNTLTCIILCEVHVRVFRYLIILQVVIRRLDGCVDVCVDEVAFGCDLLRQLVSCGVITLQHGSSDRADN